MTDKERIQRIRNAAGVSPVVAHRADQAGEGGVHVLSEHATGGCALKLVAKKLQSSLAVEGELPEDGLAAYGDEGGRPDDGPGPQGRQR